MDKKHGFLDMVEELHNAKEALPYVLAYWEVDSASMWRRYNELQKAGFSQRDALEIIKARGAIV